MHTPVFANKVIEILNPQKGKIFVDATFGEGGHTLQLLKAGSHVLAIDRDKEQFLHFSCPAEYVSHFSPYTGNFANLAFFVKEKNMAQVDGVLFDLGLSYRQIKEGKKGLSFQNENEILDMRLDDTSEISAESILHTWTEDALTNVFMRNSEDLNSKEIAREIVLTRKGKSMTVGWLCKLVKHVVSYQQKQTIARIFQALRIEVNNEFDNLKKGLVDALKVVRPGGVIVVISFHSLEDRIVKLFFKEHKLKQKGIHAKRGKENNVFERSAVIRYSYL